MCKRIVWVQVHIHNCNHCATCFKVDLLNSTAKVINTSIRTDHFVPFVSRRHNNITYYYVYIKVFFPNI